jgi:hypothetical protein
MLPLRGIAIMSACTGTCTAPPLDLADVRVRGANVSGYGPNRPIISLEVGSIAMQFRTATRKRAPGTPARTRHDIRDTAQGDALLSVCQCVALHVYRGRSSASFRRHASPRSMSASTASINCGTSDVTM